MSATPRRVDQVIPAIIEHDAVSNHTFEAQRLLREMGFESEIYASILGPGTEGRVRPVAELADGAEDEWLIYQCSIGSPVAEQFLAHRGPKMLDYHNITPAELVERWIPPLAAESRLGRAQLPRLAPAVRGSFADSPYNADELASFGFVDPAVVPILIEAGNQEATPDPSLMTTLRSGAGAKWLFVGQIAAHKAQHDIVSAFACYRELFDGDARLWIVGREMGQGYRSAVERYVRALGLTGAVTLPGSVPVGSLAAYFASADVFVCLSEHEGFNAPIVEAMSRRVPVVAYAAAAVPSTVADAGVLLDDKDPLLVAAVVHELLADAPTRAALVAKGDRRAAELSLGNARERFRSIVREILARS